MTSFDARKKFLLSNVCFVTAMYIISTCCIPTYTWERIIIYLNSVISHMSSTHVILCS